MVANNNQRPMRVSALALPLFVTLAVASASPTPAFAASEPSPSSKPTVVKPIPIEPVTPQVFEGDVRDLPKAERWKPGDPVREVNPLYGRPPTKTEGIQLEPAQPKLDPILERQESALKGEETRASSPPDRKGGSHDCQ